MTGFGRDHDPDLRRLLDSIGVNAEDRQNASEHDPEDRLRAQAMLSRITDVPRADAPEARRVDAAPRRPRGRTAGWRLAATAAACVLGALALVLGVLGKGPTPAVAQTPRLLTFTGVDAQQLADGGTAAGPTLNELAGRAEHLPAPARLPVQRVEAEAWWASTDPATGTEGPRTVLVPRRLEVFRFGTDTRRSIERRGAAIDARGRITRQPGSWSEVPPSTDETFADDQSSAYPASLPTSIEGLRRQLAPAESCAGTTGGCLLGAINDLYAGYVVEPSTTARLWRLLATDSSVQFLGSTTDRLGRPADAFAADSLNPAERITILVDPDTGQYLGSETMLVRPSADLGFRPPAVVEFIAIVRSSRIAEADVPDDATTTRY